ncbi:MAG: SIS domain-containing protein [Planctomycetota bacterium]|nr:MAG: SIS domain-containing protein [Planctomycetota bacterium]
MTPEEVVTRHLHESIATKQRLLQECLGDILAAGKLMADAIADGHKLLFCGNGGSAADSQHFATELVVRLSADFERDALPAIALTVDTSLLTACANDYGYARVFSRQVEALGQEGDCLVGISTSGGSENVVLALEAAQRRGLRTVGWVGQRGGRVAELADVAIRVPSLVTSHIQESHLAIGHVLCELVERLACGRV